MAQETTKPLSRSEREALVKDKAGWVITILAALLAVNTLLSGSNSSKILNNTIEANNTWAFYQAKSIKQTLAEMALENAKDPNKIRELAAKVARYESDPATGEGKKELMAKARKLEEERAIAKTRSPYYTYAGSIFQISIVLLTAAILSVSMPLFWGSIAVGSFGAALMSQAFWLFI
jgi:hypothetical protein